jgi:hypothetical protein
MLQSKLDFWLREANTPARNLGYKGKRDGSTVALLKQAAQGKRQPFTALNSMRDVEPGVGLILGVKE